MTTTGDASAAAGLRLTEIDGDDLTAYMGQLEQAYAQDMRDNGAVPAEVAEHRARLSTEELFPGGQLGPGSTVWRAEDEAGRPVGRLWLARRDEGKRGAYVWVYDIEVDPGRRGQGWGRRLIQEAERITREWGFSSLQLNVFGGNDVARGLYRSQGFVEQSVTMTKDVGEPP
jgi:GNAT superfamily N-acetyltransferase